MPFEAILLKTPNINKFLKLNCTHVKGDYWIYEGLDELLEDHLTKFTTVDGIVPSLGGFTESELVEGCLNWFGVDVGNEAEERLVSFLSDQDE